MSISRHKPRSVKEVEKALFAAKKRMDSVSPAEMAITAPTQTALTDENTKINNLVTASNAALYSQIKATNQMDTAKAKARMFISHYFQAYNNGIAREVFDKESRILYGLAENQSSVPPLGSEADITYWGSKVITGDAARVDAGGTAMSNPKADEVKTKLDDFVEKNTTQGLAKTAFGTAQENLSAELPTAIKVVTKVWDEVETFYDELEISAKRAKCREWGVVYESDVAVTINLTVKNKTTADAIDAALVTIVESGNDTNTDALGKAELKTSIAFGITLETSKAGFLTQVTPLEFETGITQYNLTIELMPE
jgi:hypothetical protein